MPTAYLSPSLLQDLTNVSVSPGAGNTGYPLVWNNTSGRFELAVLGVAGGGTGTSNGSITGTGALTFTATGANNNVTLTPGAGGYGNIAGVSIRAGAGLRSIGIGTVANSTGSDWIAEGTAAAINATTAFEFIAQGYISAPNNRSGGQFIAQGRGAAFESLSGYYFIAQGHNAASQCLGDGFLAQGVEAGVGNSSGGGWIAQGRESARYNVTGSNFLAQGTSAGYFNTGTRWIAQGFESGYYENRDDTWHVANTRNKSLVIGNFATNCILFGSDSTVSSVGGHPTPTAAVHCAASTTARASLRIDSGTAPTSPNNGEIWFDGTDLKIRIGGTTRTFQVT